MICTLAPSFAQEDLPPYKKNKNIPAFQLQQANNATFSTSKLKKGVPTVIMFFSPGCDHCIHQFEDMVKNMSMLKSYQIVMATYQPIEELADFDRKYKISKYPNIFTGRDMNYFLPPFYQITNFPHFAFYGRSGRLNSTHEGNLSVDNMVKRLK